MKNITRNLQIYKEMARFIHNQFYFHKLNFTFDTIDNLNIIKQQLFYQLVLDEIGVEFEIDRIFTEKIPFIKIYPRFGIDIPIFVNRPSSDGNLYWDNIIKNINKKDIEIEFINFFDWDQLNIVDFKYYIGKIISFEKKEEFIGNEVLIESEYCDVFLIKD